MLFKTQEEFEVLFNEHYQWLVTIAMRIVNDQSTAEDVVQETFITLWEKRQTLVIDNHPRAYLRVAVVNRALNYYRSMSKNNTAELNERHDEIASNEIHIPDALLLGAEAEKKVNAVLDALPNGSRLVFTLSRFEELSYKEIAEKLGVSVKAVEKHMSVALRHIRKYLPLAVLVSF